MTHERALHVAAAAASLIAVFVFVQAGATRTSSVPSSSSHDAAPLTREADAVEQGVAPKPSPEFVSPVELMRRHLEGWQRPEGPIKVAIQAGHWKSEDAPDEQDGLRTNGAEAAGQKEWQITLAIAQRVAALLEGRGLAIEVLPTVVPPHYYADVFVSVHADESPQRNVRGYRTAPSWLDLAGTSGALSDAIDAAYGEATGQQHYPEITDNMRQYYAFNWLLYEHSLHPMTPAVIIETGYMTNAEDRRVIFSRQDLAAKGIADGILAFLQME